MPKQKWTEQNQILLPRRELSNGGLESVVTLLVRWQIDYSWGGYLIGNPAVR